MKKYQFIKLNKNDLNTKENDYLHQENLLEAIAEMIREVHLYNYILSHLSHAQTHRMLPKIVLDTLLGIQ